MGNGNAKSEININEPLTSKELEYIKVSWDAVADKDELGIRLMIKLFSLDPEIKYLWIFASNLETEEEMWNNSELKYHARKVVNTVGKILTSLLSTTGNTDPVDLIRLGRRHHTYGLKKEHFRLFEDALIQTLDKVINNKQFFNDKAKKAWRKAVRHIFSQFIIGINAEIKEIEDQEKLKTTKYAMKFDKNDNT